MRMIRLHAINEEREIAVRPEAITCVHPLGGDTCINLECGTEWIVAESYEETLRRIECAESGPWLTQRLRYIQQSMEHASNIIKQELKDST